MDSEAQNYRPTRSSKIGICTIIISIVNLLISPLIVITAMDIEKVAESNVPVNWIILISNIIFCCINVQMLKSIWNRKIFHVKHCLEGFVVMSMLNIIPMSSKEENYFDLLYECTDSVKSCYLQRVENRHYIYTSIRRCSSVFFFISVVQIYFVYLYYNDESKCSQRNVSPASPPSAGDPSCPTEQHNNTTSSLNNAASWQTEQRVARPPVQYVFQSAGQNVIHKSGQNVIHKSGQNTTRPSIQYIVQQPGQYVTQQPVTPAANNQQCIVQIPLPHDQNMTAEPIQDLNLQSIIQRSVALTRDPPPYSKSEDM